MSETPNKLHRYPGVRPFSKEEANIFFGRANEAKKLYNLIMLDKVVVLFAKSGRGKSSLINAALTPLFEGNNDSYIPVEVRLGNVQGDESTPLEKLMMKLKDAVPLPDDNFLIDKLIDDSASANQENKYQYHYQLWPYLKKLQISQHKKVLLIFDQFEEFFRHSPRQQEEFRWELSELVYTQVPQFIREKIDTLNYEEYSQFSALIDVKILFSIRSDRLSEMHSMNDALPNILQNRFEISSLDINQASDAIQLPAMIEDSRFITHPFKYDTDALNTILSELSKKEDYNSENIETFHLQIICQACEAKIEEKLKNNEVDKEINTSDLPGFADLYGDYYKRQIEKLPPNLQKVAESILEEELIYGSRETGGYRRLSVDKNILLDTLATKKAPKEILDMLEDIFLIRREPNTVGGYSYEISHDTILEPIIQNRDKKEKIAAQKRLAELIVSKNKIEAEKKVGRSVMAFILLSIAFLAIYLNWESIYFGYATKMQKDDRPIVRLKEPLKNAINHLNEEILASARQIGKNIRINSWEASQLMIALSGGANDSLEITQVIKSQYYKLTSMTLKQDNCCWREIEGVDDLRASAWVVSTNGVLGLTNQYNCSTVNFFLKQQLPGGAWSMFILDKQNDEYGSTYTTCHVLRALHNSLPYITDSVKQKTQEAINKGADWLLQNIHDTLTMTWADYKAGENYENTISKSLSGLAMHTLNLIGMATPEMNQKWLRSLKSKDALIDIYYRERSDMEYKKGNEIVFRDITRHLTIPWQLIATIDAYKDGNYAQRFKANKWIDEVVRNLNIKEMTKIPRFVKAEIAMSLRYLGDDDYTFK
mgnify:CR=1 FL=1